MTIASYTIAGLAQAAGAGVETVRYYERRGLVAQPARIAGAWLAETRRRIAGLKCMERTLAHLLHEFETDDKAPRCPINAAIAPHDT
jgi:hypothetical protein